MEGKEKNIKHYAFPQLLGEGSGRNVMTLTSDLHWLIPRLFISHGKDRGKALQTPVKWWSFSHRSCRITSMLCHEQACLICPLLKADISVEIWLPTTIFVLREDCKFPELASANNRISDLVTWWTVNSGNCADLGSELASSKTIKTAIIRVLISCHPSRKVSSSFYDCSLLKVHIKIIQISVVISD